MEANVENGRVRVVESEGEFKVILCAECGIEMPDDFPVAELAEFMTQARRVLLAGGEASPAWKEFAGASNLIGWRFRASSDAWLEHRQSIEAHGDGATSEALFRRERSLFMMFSAGAACIESATYALAAVASHPAVLGIRFGPEDQRACNPKRLHAWLKPVPTAVGLKLALHRLLSAPEWTFWIELRNRMTHRSNLPRRHSAYVGSDPPPIKPLDFAATSSTREVAADLVDFDALHRWLAVALRDLLTSGTEMLRGA